MDEGSTGARRHRILVAQLSVIELLAWGILFYAFSVFLPAMQTELGWTSATLSLGLTVSLVVSGLAAPAVGAWIDRRGARGPMVGGAIAGAAGVMLWSLASDVPVYLLAWILIGLGMAGTLYAPAFATLVQADPSRSRAGILTITVVGALASTLFLPLGGALGEWLGWRAALQVLSIAFAVTAIPLGAALPPTRVVPVRHAATERRPAPAAFRIVAAAMMVTSAVLVAFNAHLIAFLIDRGHSLQLAASLAGLVGIAKLGGRVAIAAGARFTATRLMQATFFLTAAALALPLLWPTSMAAAIGMALVVGAASGARTILRPALVLETFGSGSFGKNDGALELVTTLASAAGPVGLGALLGLVGHDIAWAALAILCAGSGAWMSAVKQPSRAPATPMLSLQPLSPALAHPKTHTE